MQAAAGAARVARARRDVAAVGEGITVGGGKGAGKAGASGSSGVVQGRHEEPEDTEEDGPEEAEGRRGGRSGRRKEKNGDRREPHEVQVWQWLDDLLTGVAEIHKVTVANGHSCADCTRRNAYTGKQRIVEAVDGMCGAVNPTPDQRTGRGQGAPITFQHE